MIAPWPHLHVTLAGPGLSGNQELGNETTAGATRLSTKLLPNHVFSFPRRSVCKRPDGKVQNSKRQPSEWPLLVFRDEAKVEDTPTRRLPLSEPLASPPSPIIAPALEMGIAT